MTPTLETYQQTILSAQYVAATLVSNNLALINSGNLPINQDRITYLELNIYALIYQLNRPDYTSNTTLTLYDRLNGLIGFDTTINSLDPNAQIPGTVIVIVNPSGYIAPLDFGWADFSTDGSPDGGISRTTYYNTNWTGANPMLSLISPMETALIVGQDYSLIPTGGIILLPGGNLSSVQDGQFLRAVSYQIS